jgi:predicted MPP superfamily phosphohydrolase
MKKWLLVLIGLISLILVAVLVLMIIFTDNKTLQLTTYQITHEQIPAEFDGFRIAQVADLHNTEFGEKNADLVAMLTESDPDMIVFTGDQLDARKTDKDVVLELVRQTVQIAPCYLVTGNHEGSLPDMRNFLNQLEAEGVIVLDNEISEITLNGASIDLVGLTDPSMNKLFYSDGAKVALDLTLQELDLNKERFTILLAHRPEYLYVYERNRVDLALCGHNHGGQIRINGRGIIGPGKELFPQYDSGVYTLKNATMVLSRGLGNSIFPWRVNNPPEVVLVELKAA